MRMALTFARFLALYMFVNRKVTRPCLCEAKVIIRGLLESILERLELILNPKSDGV